MKEITSIERPFLMFFYVGIIGVTILAPFFAHAAGPVIRSGETVTVEANQVLDDDFYGLGQTVTISGSAEGDVYVAGGAVTINAPVSADLVIVGGVAQVHGDVEDDVRIIGGEVVLANPIKDDVVVIGGTVHILSTATIGGDLIFFGGDVRVDGKVEGSVYGRAERVRIDSHIGDDVTVSAGESFTLGDSTEIVGAVSYKSRNEMVRGQNAVVNGPITRETLVPQNKMSEPETLALNVLILIFSSLTIYFIARGRTERLIAEAWNSYGKAGFIGLGMILAIPIVAVILMASMIGSVVGIALIFLYLFFLLITYMALPLFIGSFFERLFWKGKNFSLVTVAIGILITALLPFIPIIGGLVILLAAVIVFGTLCLELYRVFRTS